MTTLLAIALFATQFQCLQYWDEQVVSRPVITTVKYSNMSTAIIGFHGAHAVLSCDDGMYTANLLGGWVNDKGDGPMVVDYLVSDQDHIFEER